MAILFVFSGLPASGKTTLARRVAQHRRAVHLRIDTIEQALRDLCHVQVEGEGYRCAYRIAADNLALGLDVVADSCNPVTLTRHEWNQVAESCGAQSVNIEVICSDAAEHRLRVESRISDIPDLRLPTWDEVRQREYHDWVSDRIVIDTAGASVGSCAQSLIASISNVTGSA